MKPETEVKHNWSPLKVFAKSLQTTTKEAFCLIFIIIKTLFGKKVSVVLLL